MKKRKIFNAVIALSLVFAALSPKPVQATSDDISNYTWIYADSNIVSPSEANLTASIPNSDITITDSDGNLVYGDIAEIGIYIDNITESYQVLEMSIDFDSEHLVYLGHDDDLLYEGALKYAMLKTVTTPIAVYNAEDPEVRIVCASTRMLNTNGIITKLKFFVPQGTPADSYALELSVKNFGYKENSTEITVPHIVKNNGRINVPGTADSTNALDLRDSSGNVCSYVEDNNIDTMLDGVEGCSPFDIYWSFYNQGNPQNIFVVNDLITLEIGQRGDANLDHSVDTKDAAVIAKFQSQSASSSDGEVPVLNSENDTLAKILANINNDTVAFGETRIGNIDTKDAANAAKYGSLYATYTEPVDAAKAYAEIWLSLGITSE